MSQAVCVTMVSAFGFIQYALYGATVFLASASITAVVWSYDFLVNYTEEINEADAAYAEGRNPIDSVDPVTREAVDLQF